MLVAQRLPLFDPYGPAFNRKELSELSPLARLLAVL
jgi:hypothetical protein